MSLSRSVRIFACLAVAGSCVVACVDTAGTGPVEGDGGALVLDRTALDFGANDCGSTPSPKTLTLSNAGSAAESYRLRVDPADLFRIEGATEGTLEPGQAAEIRVASGPVPTTATAGVALEAKLVVTRGDGIESSAALTLVPTGGALEITPDVVSFGQVQRGQPASPKTLTVKNVGNREVKVAFAAPTRPEFGLAWAGAPNEVVLQPGTSVEGASATFTPADNGVVSDRVELRVTGALCRSSPLAVDLGGEGVPVPVIIDGGPTMSFGEVPCRTAAPAKEVKITNANGFPINFTTTLTGKSSLYTIAPTTGTVAANSTATITVTPKTLVGLTSTTATAADGTLEVATDAPGNPGATIALKQTPKGSFLTVTGTAAFGDTTSGSSKDAGLNVANSGNAPATVSVAANRLDVTSNCGGATALSAGASRSCKAIYAPKQEDFKGASLPAGSSLVFSASNACNADLTVPVTGKGLFPSALGASTTRTLDIDVTCEGADGSVATSFTNGGAGAFRILAASSLSAPFGTNVTTSFTVAAGASSPLNVTASKAVKGTDSPLNTAATTTLTFQTNEVNHPTYTWTLNRRVHGAVLSYATAPSGAPITSFDVPATNDGGVCPRVTLYARNTGDVDVTLASKFTVSSPRTMESDGGGTLSKNGANAIVLGHEAVTAPPSGSRTEKISHTVTGAVCQALPADLSVMYDYVAGGGGGFSCTAPP